MLNGMRYRQGLNKRSTREADPVEIANGAAIIRPPPKSFANLPDPCCLVVSQSEISETFRRFLFLIRTTRLGDRFKLLAEPFFCQAGEATHSDSHGEVLAFNVAG